MHIISFKDLVNHPKEFCFFIEDILNISADIEPSRESIKKLTRYIKIWNYNNFFLRGIYPNEKRQRHKKEIVEGITRKKQYIECLELYSKLMEKRIILKKYGVHAKVKKGRK